MGETSLQALEALRKKVRLALARGGAEPPSPEPTEPDDPVARLKTLQQRVQAQLYPPTIPVDPFTESERARQVGLSPKPYRVFREFRTAPREAMAMGAPWSFSQVPEAEAAKAFGEAFLTVPREKIGVGYGRTDRGLVLLNAEQAARALLYGDEETQNDVARALVKDPAKKAVVESVRDALTGSRQEWLEKEEAAGRGMPLWQRPILGIVRGAHKLGTDIAELGQGIGRALGVSETVPAEAEALMRQSRATGEALMRTRGGYVARVLEGVGASTPQAVLALATGGLLGTSKVGMSLLNAGLGGMTTMAPTLAGDAYAEFKKSGMSDERALGLGILSGILESAVETMTFGGGKVATETVKGGLKTALVSYLKSAGREELEERVQAALRIAGKYAGLPNTPENKAALRSELAQQYSAGNLLDELGTVGLMSGLMGAKMQEAPTRRLQSGVSDVPMRRLGEPIPPTPATMKGGEPAAWPAAQAEYRAEQGQKRARREAVEAEPGSLLQQEQFRQAVARRATQLRANPRYADMRPADLERYASAQIVAERLRTLAPQVPVEEAPVPAVAPPPVAAVPAPVPRPTDAEVEAELNRVRKLTIAGEGGRPYTPEEEAAMRAGARIDLARQRGIEIPPAEATVMLPKVPPAAPAAAPEAVKPALAPPKAAKPPKPVPTEAQIEELRTQATLAREAVEGGERQLREAMSHDDSGAQKKAEDYLAQKKAKYEPLKRELRDAVVQASAPREAPVAPPPAPAAKAAVAGPPEARTVREARSEKEIVKRIEALQSEPARWRLGEGTSRYTSVEGTSVRVSDHDQPVGGGWRRYEGGEGRAGAADVSVVYSAGQRPVVYRQIDDASTYDPDATVLAKKIGAALGAPVIFREPRRSGWHEVPEPPAPPEAVPAPSAAHAGMQSGTVLPPEKGEFPTLPAKEKAPVKERVKATVTKAKETGKTGLRRLGERLAEEYGKAIERAEEPKREPPIEVRTAGKRTLGEKVAVGAGVAAAAGVGGVLGGPVGVVVGAGVGALSATKALDKVLDWALRRKPLKQTDAALTAFKEVLGQAWRRKTATPMRRLSESAPKTAHAIASGPERLAQAEQEIKQTLDKAARAAGELQRAIMKRDKGKPAPVKVSREEASLAEAQEILFRAVINEPREGALGAADMKLVRSSPVAMNAVEDVRRAFSLAGHELVAAGLLDEGALNAMDGHYLPFYRGGQPVTETPETLREKLLRALGHKYAVRTGRLRHREMRTLREAAERGVDVIRDFVYAVEKGLSEEAFARTRGHIFQAVVEDGLTADFDANGDAPAGYKRLPDPSDVKYVPLKSVGERKAELAKIADPDERRATREAQEKAEKEHRAEQIDQARRARWGILADKAISKDVYDVLTEPIGLKTAGASVFAFLTSLYATNYVGLNPSVWMRQLVTNSLLYADLGGLQPWNPARPEDFKTMRRAFDHLRGKEGGVYEWAKEDGVIGPGMAPREMGDMLRVQDEDQALRIAMGADRVKGNKGLELYREVLAKVRNTYGFFDQWLRLSVYERALEEGLSREAAARRVEETTPNYDLVPEFVRKWAQYPLGGMFLAFKAESARIILNQLLSVRGMLKLGKWLALVTAAGIAGRKALGLKRDEWEKIEKRDKLGRLDVPVGMDEQGNPVIIRLGTVLPGLGIVTAISELVAGKADAFWNSVWGEAKDWGFNHPLTLGVIEAFANKDEFSRAPIYDERDTRGVKLLKGTWHAVKGMVPGFGSPAVEDTIRDILQRYKKQTRASAEPWTTPEIVARRFGIPLGKTTEPGRAVRLESEREQRQKAYQEGRKKKGYLRRLGEAYGK